MNSAEAKEQFLKENTGATRDGGGGSPFLALTKQTGTFVEGTVVSVKKSQFGDDKLNIGIRIKNTNAITRIKDGETTVDGPAAKAGDIATIGTNKSLADMLTGIQNGAALFVEFIGKKKITGRPLGMNVFDARYKNPAASPEVPFD